MTKRRAGHLDNRNLGNRAVIELPDHTYYGIIASIRRYPNAGTEEDPGKVTITFTDGEVLHLGLQHTVDTTIAGWELTVMDIHKALRGGGRTLEIGA